MGKCQILLADANQLVLKSLGPFLEQKGYIMIAKNFSCKLGEIDLIARQGKTIVFIEVKTRSSCEFGLPQESIGPKKVRHLRRCAQFYINKFSGQEEGFRLDVVSIILSDPPQIELLVNAF